MMRGILLGATMALALAPGVAAGQGQVSTRFPAAELEAITRRGREMAAYDRAAWLGTDAAMPLLRDAPAGTLGAYLARRTPEGWEVVFGRLTATRDTFLVAYRAKESEKGYTAAAVSPVEADTGVYARSARALELAKADFGPVNRPYNAIVLPVEGSNGEWWVYLLPAPRTGVWPIGADVRYRVAADGRVIVEKRRMHNSVIESAPGPDTRGGMHTAVLDDRPEDSDVFLVLTRRPSIPEYVGSRTFMFRVNVDGTITPFDRTDPN